MVSLGLVIIMLIPFGTSLSAEDITLDFGNKLDMFSDCLLHLILNEFEGDEKPITVNPIGIPALVSRRRFFRNRRKNDNSGVETKCGNENYRPEKQHWFLFLVAPSPKLNCFVQIFVDAISCPRNKSAYKQMFYKLDFSIFGFHRFFYHRMANEKNDLIKCCTYYIHVESGSMTAARLSLKNGDSTHYVYEVRKLNPDYKIQLWDNPTALHFWTEYSDAEKHFIIKEEGVVACGDTSERVNWLRLACQNHLKTMEDFHLCAEAGTFMSNYQQHVKRKLIAYNSNTHSRESVESIRLVCLNDPISYRGKMGVILFTRVYLDEWKEFRYDAESILLQILFPNASIVNSMTGLSVPGVTSYEIIFTNNPTVLSGEQDSIHFVTCVPILKPSFLSLIGYVSAFNLSTWLMIAFCLILSICTWNLVSIKKGKQMTLTSAMVFYNILVAQSTSSINNYKWLSGGWVLAGLFLTYTYQGNNIDQLTSPLSPKNIETFDEIFSNNLTVFSLPHWYEVLISHVNLMESNNQTVKTNNLVWDAWQPTLSLMYLRKHVNMTERDVYANLKTFLKVPNNSEEALKMTPFNYYVEQISKCGRDVFIDKLIYVKRMQFALDKILGKQNENIATSRTPYGTFSQIWYSYNKHLPAEYFEIRYLSLIHSGLVKFLEKLDVLVSNF